MKRKHLTVFPCVLENVWSSIEIQPACLLLHKGLGHLLHSFLLSFIYSYFVYLLYRKPLKFRLLSICREFLIHTTSQHLLLLVGFDTLTYQKYCDIPPILVGHQDYFLAPLPRSEALLESGTGKGNFYCEYCLHTTDQHLMLLVGFDTLTYRKYCDTPLYLWVIKTIFWRRCRGVKRYWRVELVKETSTMSIVYYC